MNDSDRLYSAQVGTPRGMTIPSDVRIKVIDALTKDQATEMLAYLADYSPATFDLIRFAVL